MSGGLSISSGGAIAVDPDALRTLADDVARILPVLEDAASQVTRAQRMLWNAAGEAHVDAARAQCATAELEPAARRIVEGLRTAAAAYELIELRIARDAAAARGGRTAVDHLDARIAALAAEHPDAADVADAALRAHRATGDVAITQLAVLGAALPVLANAAWLAAAVAALRATGLGRIPRGAAPHVRVPPPPLREVPPEGGTTTAAPATLAGAVGRIPSGGDTRVRVERYELPDGTRAFAVYVTGTQAFLDRIEWMDMLANAQLFTRQDAESLAAVRAALVAAGATPGDRLYAFGHSQGGMVVDALAAEGTYRTEVLGTVGSPTSYDAPPGTFSVEVRHEDDPVAALAGGGHAQQVGAAGSFVAQRTVDPAIGPQDLGFAAHRLTEYVDTAARVDASGDPRAAALATRLDALATATEVTVTEYAPVEPPASARVSPGRGGEG